jgi:lactate racemase
MSTDHDLRTGAWYGDWPIQLDFPAGWSLTYHWPRTPPPLTDSQIVQSLENPVGQSRLRDLCRGKCRPVVLVDDVNRPTPAARIMPVLLREFEAGGISPQQVTIVMARGSHGSPRRESMLLKVGTEAASSCRLLIHDPYRHTTKLGRTSFGTPVYVNKEVLAADFVIGIGGVYPNNTAGFGGGAKLALGVLDIRVISYLHNKHSSVGWGSVSPENNFRKDIEEIARMIGLRSMITCHVNGKRELVRVRCGDYSLYYEEEVAFAREAFLAPKPAEADVVISNCFPNDLSLTFVHMKGAYPLRHARPGASRIVIGACSEGEGFHGVYPIVRMPLFHEQRDRLRRISLFTPGEIARKLANKISRRLHAHQPLDKAPVSSTLLRQNGAQSRNPIWIYRSGNHTDALPSQVRAMRVVSQWKEILDVVRREQSSRDHLNVTIYPCAPLQVLE